MLALGSLAFASPWLLVALAALPIIWWLLRVTPPAPRRIAFPAIRLLIGLVPREETTAGRRRTTGRRDRRRSPIFWLRPSARINRWSSSPLPRPPPASQPRRWRRSAQPTRAPRSRH